VTTHALERVFLVGRRAWAVGFGGTIVALKGEGGGLRDE
jgi:hypothetical protein